MNASFGAVSGVMVEVTHMVPSPGTGFDATQPAGRTGATTPSKFSENVVLHGVGVGVGVGGTVDVAVGVGDGVPVDVAVAVGVGPEKQDGNLKFPMRVLQLKLVLVA